MVVASPTKRIQPPRFFHQIDLSLTNSFRCDNHTRQSFVEWAKESWKHSVWAEAFVRQRQAKGQGFHAIIRALAYKWVRILWKCWHDEVAYDETKYLDCLRLKGSSLVPKTTVTHAA